MIDVPRSSVPGADIQPASTWLPTKGPGGLSASMVCPNGHDGSIRAHEIAADGTVTPSVVCHGVKQGPGYVKEDCDFHDHVRLVGWEPG